MISFNLTVVLKIVTDPRDLCGTARAGEDTETNDEVNALENIDLGSPEDNPKVDVVKHQTTKSNNKEENKLVDTVDVKKPLFQSFIVDDLI